MPIVATIGGEDSNSYGSLEAAIAYWGEGLFQEASGKPEAQQISALITATRRLESIRYLGERASETQALKHPRRGLEVDGTIVPETVIAQPILFAEFELANELLKGTGSGEQAGGGVSQLAQFKSLKVGPISLEMNQPAATDALEALLLKNLANLPLKVFLLIKDLISEGGGLEDRPTMFTLASGDRGRMW